MKFYNLNPLLYTYKLEYGVKIPLELKFSFDGTAITKNFIASNIIIENSNVDDFTDDKSNPDISIYKIDTTNLDKLDIPYKYDKPVYISKYNTVGAAHGEILNVCEPLEINNKFMVNDYDEIRIKTIRPDIILDENKMYIPVIIKYPLNGIIWTTKKIPTCYINFYDKEIFVYNPIVLRFYNGDSTNYSKILYPPIFLGPYLKNLILDNIKYVSYYNEYRFTLNYTQSLFNHIGSSPVLTHKSMLNYKVVYIMSKVVKKLLEKYIVEIIFVLPKFNNPPS